ncbi:MAG: Extracellular solute-binding protein family 1 [Microgenomates group bacterium GW2011_GWD1_47_13]|nr:MAG: Extracellular solute-binding protein family 1 [Microgenomates group bacterium GW2011_GWD1_47_13]
MPKFPDPAKVYSAQPVAPAPSSSPANPPPVPVYQAPPSPAVTPPPPPSPSLPIQGSPFRNLVPLVLLGGAILLLVLLFFVVLPKFKKSSGPITLTYWGLWEPASVMQEVIASYEATHPNIKINYTMQSPKNYRSRLTSAITRRSTDGAAIDTAPDIARIHNTWLPMLRSSLTPAPSTLPLSTLDDYYPVVTQNAVVEGKIYALPLGIDGLALLYNQQMLTELGATPPTDWDAFRKLAVSLTVTNPETKIIERAGAAMGTTGNVEHWSDILGLLTLQSAGTPAAPASKAVQDALTFYTFFSTIDKSWDASQPNSVYAFATGTVAMILAPSWQVAEIKAINPDLKFGVAPAPSLPATQVTWGSYWMEAVPASSANSAAAWEFIQYLSTPEVLQKMYAAASLIHTIGEPYPLISMATLLMDDPLVSPYISQAPNYQSWYLTSRTQDEGINDQLIKYYEDAVNAINNGSSINSITKTLEAGVSQVLAKFPEAK